MAPSSLPKRPAPAVAALTLCVLTALAGGCAATHGAPVIDTGETPPEATGTISGTVRMAGSNTPLSARRVTAINVSTAAKFETSTASNGGYTIKVPSGRYRLQVDLGEGESLSTAPPEMDVNRGDIDSGRDFLITIKR
jgi:hypothetical protein